MTLTVIPVLGIWGIRAILKVLQIMDWDTQKSNTEF